MLSGFLYISASFFSVDQGRLVALSLEDIYNKISIIKSTEVLSIGSSSGVKNNSKMEIFISDNKKNVIWEVIPYQSLSIFVGNGA